MRRRFTPEQRAVQVWGTVLIAVLGLPAVLWFPILSARHHSLVTAAQQVWDYAITCSVFAGILLFTFPLNRRNTIRTLVPVAVYFTLLVLRLR